MADEVNQYAFEGGDTEPETAKLIAARNAKIQELHDASIEANKTIAETAQKVYETHLATTEEIMGDAYSEPNLTGAAVPATAEAPKKAAAKSS